MDFDAVTMLRRAGCADSMSGHTAIYQDVEACTEPSVILVGGQGYRWWWGRLSMLSESAGMAEGVASVIAD